jgi:hypothetical protein
MPGAIAGSGSGETMNRHRCQPHRLKRRLKMLRERAGF